MMKGRDTMTRYEVQELTFKPKVIKNIKTNSSEIVFDVNILFYLEFDNGKKTPQTQKREFTNLKISEIEKVVSTRIMSKLPVLVVNKFLELVQSDKVNVQNVIQNNQKIKFKISTKELDNIEYHITY